ncbi:chemosensory receptor A [Elysia marginata]|uniref:Chemosensory receptor A n=1 Tax=Elysia marginata TaxID=1093978 RepID=A0AAV4IXS2_9GAST|nr:chemosensory receptor A [Elysia marginata]
MAMVASNLSSSLVELEASSTPIPSRPVPLYREEFLITFKVLAAINPAIILLGLVSNVINIVVFLKADVKDNVTILLLSLAVSDFVFLSFITPSMCGAVIHALAPSHIPLSQIILLRHFPYWPAYTVYDFSTFITVSLGVMRCACVAMPLKFKLVFTKSRTIKWVLFIVALAVSLRIPVLSIHRILWRIDPKTNISSPHLIAKNGVQMSRINDILNRGVVIYITYITMVTCVCILTFKLYQASKMRRSCKATSNQSSDKTDSPADRGLSSRDLKVVKSVVLVCTIFVLLQLPFLLVSFIRLVVPEFDKVKSLGFLFGIFSQVNSTCAYLNASLNIFIYYNYNSKYRLVFRTLMSLTSKQ